MLKGWKKFCGEFGAAKWPLCALIFASYFRFKKMGLRKNTNIFLNPIYSNFCLFLHFKQFLQKIDKIFQSGSFGVENVERYPSIFSQFVEKSPLHPCRGHPPSPCWGPDSTLGWRRATLWDSANGRSRNLRLKSQFETLNIVICCLKQKSEYNLIVLWKIIQINKNNRRTKID